jgi:tRNA G18 (ribose-2'-O)-methylase SpoU
LDAFGIQNVDIIIDKTQYNGKVGLSQKRGMRTAVGSAQWLTVNYHLSTADAIQALRQQSNDHGKDIMIYASDLNPSSQDIRNIQWDSICPQDVPTSEKHIDETATTYDVNQVESPDPTICIVMGNEERGISEEMKRLVDCTFTLPMVGFAESYNLSVATAITLAHLSARSSSSSSSSGPIRPGDLHPHQYQCLLLKGLMNSVAQKRVIKPLLQRENIILPPEIIKQI